MSTGHRIFLTIVALAVCGAMLWDQLRLKGMTPLKWVVFPAMVALCVGPIWWP
jgi:hypothetical protein